MKITASPKFLIISGTLIFFLQLTLSVRVLWAETTTPENIYKSPSSEITRDSLQNKIDSLEAKHGIDNTIKNRALKFYEAAQVQFDDIEWFHMLDTTYQESLRQAPVQSKVLKKETERRQKQASNIKSEDYTKIPFDEVKQRLIIEKGNLSNLGAQIKQLENNIATQVIRPAQIRQETLKANQEIEFAQEKLKATQSVSKSKLGIEARKIYLNTLISARSTELKTLEIEAISNPVRVTRLKTELQQLELKRKALALVIDDINETLFEIRHLGTEKRQQALSQTEMELNGKPIVIQLVTRENIQYSKDLKKITEKTEQYSKYKKIVDDHVHTIEIDFKSAEKKISQPA